MGRGGFNKKLVVDILNKMKGVNRELGREEGSKR
jgi:hypothetical protein